MFMEGFFLGYIATLVTLTWLVVVYIAVNTRSFK